MESVKILLIEDDSDIREGVRVLLESEGYRIAEAENGRQGLDMLDEDTDMIILDIMMPGISGIRTCEEIRKISYVPVLFLTAKSQESDRLLGLMAGGDDYLPKPFSYAELLGRVKALLRRYCVYQGKNKGTEEDAWIERGGIRISTSSMEAMVDGKPVELSGIEYQILYLLMKYPGKIFSTENIYGSVWQEPFFYGSSNTVMVHIRKLRMKVEKNPQRPEHICTVWGKGYRFE